MLDHEHFLFFMCRVLNRLLPALWFYSCFPIDQSLDINTQTDVLQAVDVRRSDITVVAVYTHERGVRKQSDDDKNDEKDGFSYFFVHVLTSCYRRAHALRGGFSQFYRLFWRHTVQL